MQLSSALTAVVLLQVLGDWVAKRNLDEVLRVMGEARVPSGEMHSFTLALSSVHKPSCPHAMPTNPMHCDVDQIDLVNMLKAEACETPP